MTFGRSWSNGTRRERLMRRKEFGYWTGVPVAVIEPDESAHGVRSMGLGAVLAPDARSAVKH